MVLVNRNSSLTKRIKSSGLCYIITKVNVKRLKIIILVEKYTNNRKTQGTRYLTTIGNEEKSNRKIESLNILKEVLKTIQSGND